MTTQTAIGAPIAQKKTTAPARIGRIGPNSVTQIADALERQIGLAAGADVFRRAGLLELWIDPPEEMVDEQAPAALTRALFATLPSPRARAVLAEAGRETADYVIANRIPRFARGALSLTPSRWGARALLSMIERNAWTFAGSGACATTAGPISIIEIADNPFRTPDGIWHAEVFERLFRRLVDDDARVAFRALRRDGRPIDQFQVALGVATV